MLSALYIKEEEKLLRVEFYGESIHFHGWQLFKIDLHPSEKVFSGKVLTLKSKLPSFRVDILCGKKILNVNDTKNILPSLQRGTTLPTGSCLYSILNL